MRDSKTPAKSVEDFLHHLHDTIILLGGGMDIAQMVDRCPGDITDADTDRLRLYNIKLGTLTKDKLVNVHKLTIDVG